MKTKTQYACQSCGYVCAKWLGRCPACEGWNSLVEERTAGNDTSRVAVNEDFKAFKGKKEKASQAESSFESISMHGALVTGKDWLVLDETESTEASQNPENILAAENRFKTGISELDRVLGGGLLRDSFTLLGGDPGIGKSTLLLQMAGGLIRKNPDIKVLYASGEESVDQIRSRAHRLGVAGKGRVFLAAETLLEQVFASVKEIHPDVVVIDSLQTFSTGSLESAPGSISQVREVAARLMALAKSAGIAVWLVGHVTKEGNIAGPKVVEHMVDTVLYFEGEGGQTYRLLRTVKNRFGSTRELGVFEMEGEGLKEVSNPSSLFLSERKEPVAGTAIAASLEGSRPILVELQALVAPSGLSVPRRTSVGMDGARVSLLAAILERHMELSLADQDLFFNVAGGLKLSEPACDLAAAAAIWSSAEERPFPNGWMFIGELALTGEVRRVTQLDVRIQEARKLGFKTVVIPENTPKAILERAAGGDGGIRILTIANISELPRLMQGS